MRLVEDKVLLEGFRRGESEALREVYLHYAPALYRFLQEGFSFSSRGTWYRVSGITDRVEQENLVQETFARCLAEGPRRSYDGKRPFLPYLKMACQRVFLAEKRLLKWIDTSHTEEALQALPSKAPSVERAIESEEVQALLEQALTGLSAREQEVFRAIYEEGESQQQAATRLGLGRMQVRTSLKAIRKALLEVFKETGYLTQLQKPQREAFGAVLFVLQLLLDP